jgi:mono/diheme cytochrome c family protein
MYFKNKFFIFSVMIILPVLYFLITYTNTSNASIDLNTTDNSVIANGKKIYAENCASCHGVNLEGQKKLDVKIT